MSTDEPIGLIAGAGRMPLIAADGILAAGRKLVVVGLKGFTSPRLVGLADEFHWAGLTRLGRWIRCFRRTGVRDAVMIGSVRKGDMHCRFRLLRYLPPDWRAVKIWYHKLRKDKRDNAVLLAVAEELSREGIELISSVEYCKEHLAEEGVMTRTAPRPAVAEDVEFGWRIARASADLDIGQAIAVKERDIIAVEAVEGTDAMIRRAGELCPSGDWTLVKVARPDQDMRFDVPTIGPETIRNLAKRKCACLVLEAGKTILADKPATLALADRLKIAVVGRLA
jgi:DUF1009 family protein